MSVSSVGSNKDLAYLQSLLQQGSSGISDPLASLFSAFTGANGGQPSASSSGGAAPGASGASGACGPQFSSDTLGAMISLQSDQAGSSGSLFAKFDTDGDGKISQTEFENAIGPNADKSLVDSLFQKIDSDGDGGITQDELTSAQNTALSHAHHHHHHMGGGGQAAGAGSGSGGLNDLLSGSDVAGATTQTVSNPDGSSTTTITYADGSTVSTSTPDPQSSGGGSGNSSGSQNADSNLIEQLIKMQSQLIKAATNVISAIV